MELTLLVLLAGLLGFGIGRRTTLSLPPSSAGRNPPRTTESPGVRGRKAEYDLEAALPHLERHTRLILQSFGPEIARCAPVHFPALTDDDRMEYLKRAIRFAALRFGVALDKVFVRFSPDRKDRSAGSIRRTDRGWFIEVRESYREDDEAVTLVAAHELAHYALLGRDVRIEDSTKEEELTDTLVVLAGFGPLMLRVYHREFSGVVGNEWRSWVSGLGYLHPTAIAYLSVLQAEIAGLDPAEVLDWRSAWYDEPAAVREERKEARAKEGGPPCHVCGAPLPPPGPGCRGWGCCDMCRVVQRMPSQR